MQTLFRYRVVIGSIIAWVVIIGVVASFFVPAGR